MLHAVSFDQSMKIVLKGGGGGGTGDHSLIRYQKTVTFHYIILNSFDHQIISRAVNSLPNVLVLVNYVYGTLNI